MCCPNCHTQPPLIQIAGNIWTCPACDIIVVTGRNTREIRERIAQHHP